MSLPKRISLDTISKPNKANDMKNIKSELEKRTRELKLAKEANDVARVKALERVVADLKGTVSRNK